jgi:hypothetical protein
VYLRADTIEPAFAIVTFEAPEGPAADPSIQNDCTLLFVCNDLACLPVANCTTGTQRFLAALSNRGTAGVGRNKNPGA